MNGSAPQDDPTHPPRRASRDPVLAAALGRTSRITRRQYRVRVPRLAHGTTPMRIAHLTDLHVGRVTPEARLEAAVAAANAFRPDIVCLTGDYVAHSLRYLSRLTRWLRDLEGPAFATMGNHDHWHGAHEVGRALEAAGVHVLWNASAEVRVGGLRWRVVGIDDAVTGNHDVEQAFTGCDDGEPTVVLSHLAELAPAAARRGAALVLSGHTHGGQIQTGRVMERVMRRMGHRYIMGWYQTGGAGVYVNRGIGAAVFPWRSRHAGAEVAGIELLPCLEGEPEIDVDEAELHDTWLPHLPA